MTATLLTMRRTEPLDYRDTCRPNIFPRSRPGLLPSRRAIAEAPPRFVLHRVLARWIRRSRNHPVGRQIESAHWFLLQRPRAPTRTQQSQRKSAAAKLASNSFKGLSRSSIEQSLASRSGFRSGYGGAKSAPWGSPRRRRIPAPIKSHARRRFSVALGKSIVHAHRGGSEDRVRKPCGGRRTQGRHPELHPRDRVRFRSHGFRWAAGHPGRDDQIMAAQYGGYAVSGPGRLALQLRFSFEMRRRRR